MFTLSKNSPESALIPVIFSHKDKIAPGRAWGEKEVESGYGIADLVFYSLDQESIKSRRQQKIPRLKSHEILETLSFFNRNRDTKVLVTQLYKGLPYSEKFINSHLIPFLLDNEICTLKDGQYLKTQWRYKIAMKQTVAIEAKVENWKRGLYQAYRYRRYADFSYLAIRKDHLNSPLKNINLFKQANVGLISVDPKQDEIAIHFKPIKEKIMKSVAFKMYTNEYILQRHKFID